MFSHRDFAGTQKIVVFRVGANISMDACPKEPGGNMRPISEYKDRRLSVIISKSISTMALINASKLLSSSMTLLGYRQWSLRPLSPAHDTVHGHTSRYDSSAMLRALGSGALNTPEALGLM